MVCEFASYIQLQKDTEECGWVVVVVLVGTYTFRIYNHKSRSRCSHHTHTLLGAAEAESDENTRTRTVVTQLQCSFQAQSIIARLSRLRGQHLKVEEDMLLLLVDKQEPRAHSNRGQ